MSASDIADSLRFVRRLARPPSAWKLALDVGAGIGRVSSPAAEPVGDTGFLPSESMSGQVTAGVLLKLFESVDLLEVWSPPHTHRRVMHHTTSPPAWLQRDPVSANGSPAPRARVRRNKSRTAKRARWRENRKGQDQGGEQQLRAAALADALRVRPF